jgi:hypothetical protein
MRRLLKGIPAVLVLALAFIGLNVGTAQAADCWSTFHARPTATGTYADPCSTYTVNTGNGWSTVLQVQFFWDMSGGAHITDVRGLMLVCATGSNIASVGSNALDLGKVAPASGIYASSTQAPATSTSCVTMVTPYRAARGCGDRVHPSGPNAYSSRVHGYWHVNAVGGGTGGTIDDISMKTYFVSVIAGAVC